MYKGSIEDIKGIKAGHYTDKQAKTGCTVILAEQGAVCGVDVRGSAPGTRETDLLRPMNMVQKVHGVLLSGGSAFGLDAASGVMRFLEEKGIGFDTPAAKIPIVPAAVLYDLEYGSADIRPDAKAGYKACQNADTKPIEQGSAGAGTGATCGKILGQEYAGKCGIGTASLDLGGGVIVAAIFAVNAIGDVVDHKTGSIIAGLKDNNGNFLNTVECILSGNINSYDKAGMNTTIGVLATNAVLNKEQANKLAAIGHDGLAMSIRPVHTMMDGDTVFALATGEKQEDINRVLTAGAKVVSMAIENAAIFSKEGD